MNPTPFCWTLNTLIPFLTKLEQEQFNPLWDYVLLQRAIFSYAKIKESITEMQQEKSRQQGGRGELHLGVYLMHKLMGSQLQFQGTCRS